MKKLLDDETNDYTKMVNESLDALKPAENFLIEWVLPLLEQGRPGFDRPHTEYVVEVIKGIILNSPDIGVEAKLIPVLVIAAYLHDWGYSEIYKGGVRNQTYESVHDDKTLHMKLGSESAVKLLKEPVFNSLTNEQKELIVYLVRVHDNLEEVENDTEKRLIKSILIEADSLGSMNPYKVKPSFDKVSYLKYRNTSPQKRLPHFVTEKGKQLFNESLELMDKYIGEMSEEA